MAWYDGLFAGNAQGQGGLSDDDKKSLANSGLLQAGLQTLSANSTPGVTPGQALAGGLLGGINSVQQGSQSLIKQRGQAADQQFQQTMQADQEQQMQRRQKIQDLALQFKKPDGSFDMPGYQQALSRIDPQAAMELHQNEMKGQIQQQQVQMNQRDLSTPQTRKLESGNNQLTQEQQADGSWKTIATGSRFAPQQTQNRYQFVTGADGKQYRANAQTGDLQPVLNADGTPFSAAVKAAGGGTQGAAAIIKSNAQLNKLQAEGNYAAEAAANAAAVLTGVPVEQIKAMSPADVEQLVKEKSTGTGVIGGHFHPFVNAALDPYVKQMSMSNAVINSQGNKPNDVDIQYGEKATVGMGKDPETNAKLIRQSLERPAAIADQINTWQTQLANGGKLPDSVTHGGAGAGFVPGSPNLPATTAPRSTAPAAGGWSVKKVN
jgi:hypothetical protein